MTARGWRRTAGASIAAAALLLAGCGGGGSGGGSDKDSHGPLAEFFGWDNEGRGGDYEASEEERQQHYRIQEFIVKCMADAGFEYHPEPFWGDNDNRFQRSDPWEEAWKLEREDPEAFAKQYGYAITTIEYNYDEEDFYDNEWDPSDDPNWEYRESLSEAAQREYESALWGEWPEDFDWEDEDNWDYDPGGCQNEAYDQAYGRGDGDDDFERFETLWQEWETLYERIENDPKLTEARQAWTSCMADAGHPGLTNLWAGRELVYERQSELYGWNDWEEPPPFDSPEDEEAYWESYRPDEPSPEEVEDLRQFELDLAWADYTCKKDHDVERIEREVRFGMEQAFINDHREMLEEYRDFMNERQGLGG